MYLEFHLSVDDLYRKSSRDYILTENCEPSIYSHSHLELGPSSNGLINNIHDCGRSVYLDTKHFGEQVPSSSIFVHIRKKNDSTDTRRRSGGRVRLFSHL